MGSLILKSLRYYWRTHLAVLAGVFVASTVLTGALFVGDSVKASLRDLILERSGGIGAALLGNDRFFSQDLGEKVAARVGVTAVSVMQVQGTVANETGTARAPAIQVIGVPETFWALRGEARSIESGTGWINRALAERLGVEAGETVIARVEQPGAISRDAPFSGETDAVVTMRLEVGRVLEGADFGNYSLKAEQEIPLNLFVPMEDLARTLDRVGRANLLLIKGGDQGLEPGALETALEVAWTADDADLVLEERSGRWEVTSRRVLLDPRAEEIIRQEVPGARGVLTYLVNALVSGENEVPYSMVTAVEPGTDPLPVDAAPGTAIVNQWLADDLGIGQGASLTLRYHVFSPGRKLEEKETAFTVAGVVPMDHPAVDASWTPDFPGVSEAENCRDWEPGIPVDLDRIRDQDEAYWDTYKGTPKAFIRLEDGQAIWRNRFGQLTSLRLPEGFDGEAFRPRFDTLLKPSEFGVHLIDLEANRARAVEHSLDFGLYLSMLSYFIIAAAIILTVLLFALGLDQREIQVGTLRALGFRAHDVRKAYFLEGAVVALIGSVLGVAGGLAYTTAMIAALRSVWSGAIGGMEIVFEPGLISGVLGANVIFFVSVVALIVATRRISQRRPVELLSGMGAGGMRQPGRVRRRLVRWGMVGAVLLAVGSLAAGRGQTDAMAQTLTFFTGGTMTLIAGLLGGALLLGHAGRWLHGWHGLLALGIRNGARKRGRSLSVMVIMAAGVFMVCATSAFRQDASGGDGGRQSGTGGFELVGESSLPIYRDLNEPEAREEYALDAEDLDFTVVSFRVREGEEASCLNLNQAQRPRLMAVDPAALAGRVAAAVRAGPSAGDPVEAQAEVVAEDEGMAAMEGDILEAGRGSAFTFQAVSRGEIEGGGAGSPWEWLSGRFADGAIPGVMDFNSATYALKVGLGDEITYEDELGRPLRVRLVGLLQNSLLQGSVIIAEDRFLEAFPSAGGYRYFLVEVPGGDVEALSADVTRMLGDRGLSLTPAAERLNAFNNVQNTYLQMFTTLGGLGLMLGTAGLAVVTFRNVLERRRELALMEAVGFTRPRLTWLIVSEHGFLHATGVLLGAVAAFLAIYPALTASGQEVPVRLIGVVLGVIFVGGLIFCWLAARTVFRRPLLESLRHE